MQRLTKRVGRAVWRHRSTIAAIASVAVCFANPVLCAVASVGAAYVRKQQYRESWRQFGATAATAGLSLKTGLLLKHYGSMRGLSRRARLAVNGSMNAQGIACLASRRC